jgi:hypothetical protein
MQVFSTFEHSSFVELAISLLEEKGIHKEHIFAVPLDNRTENTKLLDTIHRSDGVSIFDLAMALATAFSVVGASIGFKLAWGPIYWGLISAFIGFLIGFGIKFIYLKAVKKNQRLLHGNHSEIILIIKCDDNLVELVETVLWNHQALGMAKIK